MLCTFCYHNIVTMKHGRNLAVQSLVSCHKTTLLAGAQRHTLMITRSVHDCNSISQDFYDKFIKELPFHQLTGTCSRAGCLTIHGYYYRTIKFDDNALRLRVCRVICHCCCGITHAPLLLSLVPYSQVLFRAQRELETILSVLRYETQQERERAAGYTAIAAEKRQAAIAMPRKNGRPPLR